MENTKGRRAKKTDNAPKKRGKKASSSHTPEAVLDVTNDEIEFSTTEPPTYSANVSDDENVIVKLCVDNNVCSDDEKNIHYNHQPIESNGPLAYNFDEYSVSKMNNVSPEPPKYDANDISQSDDSYKTLDVLGEFGEKSRIGEWPQDTSTACYWCCHHFNTSPVGLPISYNEEKFDVFGCFCSLECACAYNFRMANHMDEMWERNGLINMLARKLGRNTDYGPVKPAPDRVALRLFGGHMTIEEFRAFSNSSKTILVNIAPIMSSTTQQLEEINDGDLTCHRNHKSTPQGNVVSSTTSIADAMKSGNYVPLDHGRIDRYTTEMKFKRSKPIITGNNSLETSMNVRFKDS